MSYGKIIPGSVLGLAACAGAFYLAFDHNQNRHMGESGQVPVADVEATEVASDPLVVDSLSEEQPALLSEFTLNMVPDVIRWPASSFPFYSSENTPEIAEEVPALDQQDLPNDPWASASSDARWSWELVTDNAGIDRDIPPIDVASSRFGYVQERGLPDQVRNLGALIREDVPGQVSIQGLASFVTGDRLVLEGQDVRLLGVAAPSALDSCADASGEAYDCEIWARGAMETLISNNPVQCALAEEMHIESGARFGWCNVWVNDRARDMGEIGVLAGVLLASSDAGEITPYVMAQRYARSNGNGLWSGMYDKGIEGETNE